MTSNHHFASHPPGTPPLARGPKAFTDMAGQDKTHCADAHSEFDAPSQEGSDVVCAHRVCHGAGGAPTQAQVLPRGQEFGAQRPRRVEL